MLPNLHVHLNLLESLPNFIVCSLAENVQVLTHRTSKQKRRLGNVSDRASELVQTNQLQVNAIYLD